MDAKHKALKKRVGMEIHKKHFSSVKNLESLRKVKTGDVLNKHK